MPRHLSSSKKVMKDMVESQYSTASFFFIYFIHVQQFPKPYDIVKTSINWLLPWTSFSI